ncbi:sulfotransferase domain-containing protein [Allofrancisella inopinata]|uniref:Sulfotransferase n=1 Tax=Allofrancisella inopinata TaxID=1085647 RepID=A0AAE7CQ79_9GAMM|nr:sulfotransferase domain-containing protein [Allofrancisella inopinata]QIV95581.1 sulfotransferase [Allofrancisella inopinata]TDT70730.1 sulfotransferase domain-containing protein [Allofrancisella inopinata]
MKKINYKTVWLASYPKSGNTWFRVFLTNYINDSDKPASIDDLERTPIASSRGHFDRLYGIDSADLYLDEIDAMRPAMYDDWKANDSIQFHKIHDAYTYVKEQPLLGNPAGQAAIYLIRNPLDVAVSFTHHNGHEDVNKTIKNMAQEDFALCSSDKTMPNQLRQKHLTWSNHVKSWENAPIDKIFLRYEDMVVNPIKEFTKAIKFLGLEADEKRIKKAVEFSSFENLKKQEEEKGFQEKAPNAKSFFRKGKASDYLDTLSQEQINQIIKDHKEIMVRYGFV